MIWVWVGLGSGTAALARGAGALESAQSKAREGTQRLSHVMGFASSLRSSVLLSALRNAGFSISVPSLPGFTVEFS